ncbi:MAG: ABC transporter permease, partial [Lachnospiraceae bacterium]|nr:ABC transporter permease [Lachnospiraceae bacterium]
PWFETDVSRVYFPISAMNAVYGDDIMSSDMQDIDMICQMYFKTADHEKMTSELDDQIKSENLNGDVIDQAESSMAMRMIVFAARVFIYGFIILISLIAAANVFNIISTGVILRKREFAMLRSVGMSRRGLRKMLKAESFQYGTKALVIGIPVAVLISFVIWRIVSVNIESAFYLPVVPIVIAIAVVFAVIFISMHFAEKRISAANLIDALKDENI